MRVLFVVAAALAAAARDRPRAGDRHAQPRADRARRVEVDERGRGQRRHAPGRRQAGRRRARRPAAGGRADRPARVRLEGGRDLARGGVPGHRADDPGRARWTRSSSCAAPSTALDGQGPDADRQLAAGHARRPRLLRGPPERDPGLRRRRQLRAAEPVRGGARGARQAGSTSSISVVGLQVNERVRRQLECIARAGGGSYSDVQDADELGDELAGAAGPRLPRPTSRPGPRSQGATDRGRRAGARAPGLFQDTIRAGEQRWYTLDVPEGRRRARLGDARSRRTSRAASATFRTELCDPGRRRGARPSRAQLQRRAVGDGARARRDAERRARGPGRRRAATSSASSLDGGDFDDVTGRARDRRSSSCAPGEELGLTREAGRAGDADADADGRAGRPRRRTGRRRRRRGSAGSSSPGIAIAGRADRAGRRARARPQGGDVRLASRSPLALLRAAPPPAARPGRLRAGRRRRLVQRRADPRARPLPRHAPARPSTSTTRSGSSPASACTSPRNADI